MKCKYLALTAIALCLFGSTINVSANSIDGKTLPKSIQMQENNQKTLIFGSEKVGLQKKLLQEAAIKENIYSLLYKNEADYRYGIAGDVQIGNWMLQTYALKYGVDYEGNNSKMDILLQTLVKYVEAHPEYNFIVKNDKIGLPYKISSKPTITYNANKKAYYTLIEADFVRDNVDYKEIIHLKIYDDRFYGPSIRFISLKSSDDKMLWPKVKGLIES